MSLVKNPPKTPIPQAKEGKTRSLPTTTGKMKLIDGVAVMMPPDEIEEILTEEDVKTIVEKNADVVTVQTEELSSWESEVQHVYDSDSEELSRKQAEKIRQENEARAKAAAIETKPKKIGNVTVAESDSYSDIDLSILDEKEVDSES